MSSTAVPPNSGDKPENVPHLGDPFALALFGQLAGRSTTDRNLVLLALQGRLNTAQEFGQSARGSRAELCRRSVLLCADETGGRPSAKKYTAWRTAQEDPTEWPSATTVRNTFGSWPRALAACGLAPAPDVRGRALSCPGPALTAEVLVLALQTWDAETPGQPRSFAAYRRWALASRAQFARRGIRLPSDDGPFTRVFGTWRRAMAAAGLITANAEARPERWRGSDSDYTAERIIEQLRKAADDLGVAGLTAAAFERWADERCSQARCAGESLTIASTKVISEGFGSWNGALVAASLISTAEAQAGWPRLPDERLVAVLRDAIRAVAGDLAHPISGVAYKAWRRDQLAQSDNPQQLRLPSLSTLVRHFGSWPKAMAAATATTQ